MIFFKKRLFFGKKDVTLQLHLAIRLIISLDVRESGESPELYLQL